MINFLGGPKVWATIVLLIITIVLVSLFFAGQLGTLMEPDYAIVYIGVSGVLTIASGIYAFMSSRKSNKYE